MISRAIYIGESKVEISGEDEEVNELIKNISQRNLQTKNGEVIDYREVGSTLTMILITLVTDGFFKEPKKFREIRIGLEEQGVWAIGTTTYPVLYQLMMNGILKRERSKDFVWEYSEVKKVEKSQ